MVEPWETLWQLVQNLWTLFVVLLQLALHWSVLIVWLAWAFLGLNWKKLWPVLALGGWVPVVLLIVLAALVWSQMLPGNDSSLLNFWRRLGMVSLVVAATLFCGRLQGVFHWTPADIDLEPPPLPAEHDHAHH